MALPLAGIAVALAGSYLAYSLVSLVSHAVAIVGGIGVLVWLIRYLVEERPVELLDDERLDNVLYAVFSIPVSFLAYRVFESLLVATSILIVLLLAAFVVLGALLGPVKLVGIITALVRQVKQ